MKSLNLENKVIVLTGAAGFVGKNLKCALEKENAKVIAVDSVGVSGVDVLDITNSDLVDDYIQYLSDINVKIDGLVNNAGISIKGLEISDDYFKKTIDVNIFGTYNCITKFKKIMNKNASIINIGSIYGVLSPNFEIYNETPEEFNNVSYGATKAAVAQFSRYYSVLYAKDNIRMNTVSPAGIYNNHSSDFKARYNSKVPEKRMVMVEEVSNVVLFLLSHLSSGINGQNIIVDAALSAW